MSFLPFAFHCLCVVLVSSQQYELLYRRGPFPHSSSTSFIANAEVLATDDSVIPVLAIFVRVGTGFLRRCLWSIDFPIVDLAIIQDGEDETDNVKKLLNEFILSRKQNRSASRVEKVRHVVNVNHTGCSQGWNTVYYLYPSQPFWIFSSNDILFLPGQLEIFYREITRILSLPNSRVGKMSAMIDFGGGAVRRSFGLMTWATTRKGVLEGGLYDENFYPSYFEDDDILIRFQLAALSMIAVNATMRHGDKDATYEYGSVKEDASGLYKAELGRSRNQHYLVAKWNVKNYNPSIGEMCRLHNPSTHFCTPFDALTSVTNWTFIPLYRKCIELALTKDCGVFLPNIVHHSQPPAML